jgi:hypothetical protein
VEENTNLSPGLTLAEGQATLGRKPYLIRKESGTMSLEYVMQAITLVFVMALTFVALYIWAKFKKWKRR